MSEKVAVFTFPDSPFGFYFAALTLKTLSRNKPKGQKSSSNTDCASSVDIDQQKEMNQDKETDIQDVPTLEETAR